MNGTIERNTLLKPRVQRHRRLRHAMDIEVRTGYTAERVRSHDLSAGGVFVDSALDYATGMIVELSFNVDGRPIETRARVVHVRPQMGFGAQFLDLKPADRNHILCFVHRERATREAERMLGKDTWTRKVRT